MSDKYREAGVNLEAGYESVRLIKSHVARTKVKVRLILSAPLAVCLIYPC